MTDGRIPGKWISEPRFAEMADATFGFLARALAWSNEAGTDGMIKRRYLAQLHSDGEQKPAVYEHLERLGLWAKTTDGYQFNDWDKPAHRGGLGQSLAASVQAGKERNRAKQQRHRERIAVTESRNPVTEPSDVGQDRTGQDRLNTDEGFNDENINTTTGEILDTPAPITSWPVAPIPPDPGYCDHGMTVGVRCRKCPGEVAQIRGAA